MSAELSPSGVVFPLTVKLASWKYRTNLVVVAKCGLQIHREQRRNARNYKNPACGFDFHIKKLLKINYELF